MEDTRAEGDDCKEQESNAGIEGSANRGVKSCLASSAEDSQEQANHVEFSSLGLDEERAELSNHGMKRHVKPASDRIDRRVFPCLKTISMLHIVCWLPEVEDFIAILNWSKESCETVDKEADVEGDV